MKFVSLQAAQRLADHALRHGGAHVDQMLHVIEWNVNAYCEGDLAKRRRTVVGRELIKGRSAVSPKTIRIELSGLPCRKCAKCLWVRSCEWTDRAMKEMSRHKRTWFATFTMNPETHHRTFIAELAIKTSISRERPGKGGYLEADFDTAEKQFRLRVQGGQRLLTNYWKKVRKPWKGELPVTPRYMVSVERHKSGLPHFHALISEADTTITYDRLASRWVDYGFFNAKLVRDDEESARYCTKYIAKEMIGRVQCSLGYGATDFAELLTQPPAAERSEPLKPQGPLSSVSPFDEFLNSLYSD